MDASLQLPDTRERKELYKALAPQLDALLGGEQDPVAILANAAAAIHQTFGWHWVGFYRVQGQELVLGPFQGPVACMRIGRGKGVCGTAWKEARTIVVPDVELFPGHIACSPLSRSEIVVPLLDRNGQVTAVLDVDSSTVDDLGADDAKGLELLCHMIESRL